jgi:hypothetical protein
MVRRAALCAALAAVGACREPTAGTVSDARVVGQWVVTDIDSSTGAGGELQIGFNTPAGMYEMVVTQPVADSFSSAGTYTWDGAVLALTDSAGKPPMSGSLVAGLLHLRRGPHTIDLMKLIELPGVSEARESMARVDPS